MEHDRSRELPLAPCDSMAVHAIGNGAQAALVVPTVVPVSGHPKREWEHP
jgi:hypothetical protein